MNFCVCIRGDHCRTAISIYFLHLTITTSLCFPFLFHAPMYLCSLHYRFGYSMIAMGEGSRNENRTIIWIYWLIGIYKKNENVYYVFSSLVFSSAGIQRICFFFSANKTFCKPINEVAANYNNFAFPICA